MTDRRDGPSLRDLALVIAAIFALGLVALWAFGGETSKILSNVSPPI